jgi:hypothetical protein
MEKSSQIAWKLVPLRHFFPLKIVPLIEVLLYMIFDRVSGTAWARKKISCWVAFISLTLLSEVILRIGNLRDGFGSI